ncbi:MAG: cardiolipin synthase [Christensenellaceae bacterium]
MKKRSILRSAGGAAKKKKGYLPGRFVVAILLIVLETAGVVAMTCLCAYYIPFFYLAMWATEIVCVLRIVNSEENPDYKIPWLLLTLLVPVAGFMIYFMFYDRRLTKKQMRRIGKIIDEQVHTDDGEALAALEREDRKAYLQAKLLCKLSRTHVYRNTGAEYYPTGEDMNAAMLADLQRAEKYIFLEYFIIEEGVFWNGILEILKEKVAQGVEVRVVYDDVGCMLTLPGDYDRTLRSYGIKAVRFSPLRGQANNEFNNRSHRKIMVIDGKIGYTGGVNIADEYINETQPFGRWKDAGLRMEGEAVRQLTSIFLGDYGLNGNATEDFSPYFREGSSLPDEGYVVPFSDGPKPIYGRRAAKTIIMNLLNQSQHYVYMMSPYLIIDNELCQAIENAAMRGVDVRIVTPHIPDKKIVFLMTRSYYRRLGEAGVRIFEYEPGFLHAKVYLADDEYGIVGTINLDYRSLVHHFENGVWLYRHDVLRAIKADVAATMAQSVPMNERGVKDNILQRLIRSLVRIFSPML